MGKRSEKNDGGKGAIAPLNPLHPPVDVSVWLLELVLPPSNHINFSMGLIVFDNI